MAGDSSVPAMEAPQGGGRVAARPKSRRSPPRRDPWRRIGPGGASLTRRKAHGRRAGSRSPPPGSQPVDTPLLATRQSDWSPPRLRSPWRQWPPRPVASGVNGATLGSQIREVGPRTAACRRRVKARPRSGPNPSTAPAMEPMRPIPLPPPLGAGLLGGGASRDPPAIDGFGSKLRLGSRRLRQRTPAIMAMPAQSRKQQAANDAAGAGAAVAGRGGGGVRRRLEWRAGAL